MKPLYSSAIEGFASHMKPDLVAALEFPSGVPSHLRGPTLFPKEASATLMFDAEASIQFEKVLVPAIPKSVLL
jgi:hypothetical protein